jgi:hypothetical protein
LAAAASSHEAWQRDAEGLRERITAIERAAEALGNGEANVDPRAPTEALSDKIEGLAGARDERLQELFRRVLRDQTLRFGFGFDEQTSRWREGLSPQAEEAWRGLLGALIVETDCSNTAWMKVQLREVGWFDRRTYGAAADNAAWLLVQHADMSPSFQVETLQILERLAAEGGTNGQNFAYLWDRVAVAEGRPQRFGSQMECADGVNRPIGGIEDPEHVEERRAALRMQTYASYLEVMARLSSCPAP